MTGKPSDGTDAPPNRLQRVVFGFPSLPHALIAYPFYSLLPAFYAANTQVTLAQIGLVAAACRIFDAITDPLLGYLSDKTRTRIGSRKPWMLAAILVMATGTVQLFNPPASADFLYFGIWSWVLYIGFSMFELPRSAWASEITRDYGERSKLAATVGAFNIAGSLTVYALPIGMSFFTGSSAIGVDTMNALSIVYLVAMPAGIITAVLLVPKGNPVSNRSLSVFSAIRSLSRCKPLLRFYAIISLWALGQGAFMAVSFIFQTEYLGLREEFAYVMITYFAASLFFMPLWSRILIKIDRHRIWGTFVALGTSCGLIALLLPRGPEAFIPILFLTVLRGFLGTPQNFLSGAVLSDVIDYETLKSGTNKAGNMFALQNMLISICMAIGGAVSFVVLDISGFQMGQPSTPGGDLGIIICYIFIPLTFHLMMALLCWNFPINRTRHAIIQRRLDQRSRRLLRSPETHAV